jgi:glycosyltransferase involved in cell wall biosynthesis
MLQRDSRRRALLIGRGGQGFARELEATFAVGGQILTTGFISSDEVASSLVSCDVVLQPYADGISARRTSAMAALALGMPIATNAGAATEPVWRESGAVALANSVAETGDTAEVILNDPEWAAALRSAAKRLYDEQFSIERTLALLRAAE